LRQVRCEPEYYTKPEFPYTGIVTSLIERFTMQLLSLGSTGDDVQRWQYFLIGQGFLNSEATGNFGPLTKDATERYQRARHILDDGTVGNSTLNTATTDGFALFAQPDNSVDKRSIYFPPCPQNIHSLRDDERKAKFGDFKFTPSPTADNPEHVTIDASWVGSNITLVDLGVFGGQHSLPQHAQLHVKAKDPFLALLDAWQKAGLLDRIVQWGGSFVPRFKRGSTTSLSNHTWGTAFDINEAKNPLGATPPIVGTPGSVRELVQIANSLGWFWGGHYHMRLDGMHFELSV
jgi:hypothetical protein